MGYFDATNKAGPKNGKMYTTQCIWQETPASVEVGELYASSLLKDEARSTLNALITQRIKSNGTDTSKIGMIEVNNVCDGGPALRAALLGI
jgi:hypothetical protein